MDNFEFYNPARVIFGKGVENKVGELVSGYSQNKKCLLHYGGGSAKRSGLLDRVKASLENAGITYVELGGVVPNPRLTLAKEGIRICRENDIDFVLAVGGGSVIDSSKCIALGTYYDGDVWDFFKNNALPFPARSLPVGSVLTIPAAGSETSNSCVITNEDGWLKRSFNHTRHIPKFTVVNPENTFTLPPYQVACGCVDIMSHLMERYFTLSQNVDVSDRMIEGLLHTMLAYTPKTLADPQNYDYRAEVCWTGTIAHNGLLNCGRIGDWACHAIEHELSGKYDVAHGAGLAILTPAWIRYVFRNNKARFLQFATRVMGIDLACEHIDSVILDAADKLESLFRSWGLPTRLREIGAKEEDFKELAEKTLMVRKPGAIQILDYDDIYKILQMAYE